MVKIITRMMEMMMMCDKVKFYRATVDSGKMIMKEQRILNGIINYIFTIAGYPRAHT